MDARKEAAPIIAIAGDVESSLIDTSTLEELNPYKFFEAASLYTARLVNPEQARANARAASRPPLGRELHAKLADFYARDVAAHIRGAY